MVAVCINLSDAASMKGCSVDYLLALGEAGHLRILARLPPYRSYGKDSRNVKVPGSYRIKNGLSYLPLHPRFLMSIRAEGECELKGIENSEVASKKSVLSGATFFEFTLPIPIKLADLFIDEAATCDGVDFFPNSISASIRKRSQGATPATAIEEFESMPRGSYETKLLRKLHGASAKWWDLFDPSDPSTAPTNKQVADWLIGEGVTPNIATAMATILRADGLKTGRR